MKHAKGKEKDLLSPNPQPIFYSQSHWSPLSKILLRVRPSVSLKGGRGSIFHKFCQLHRANDSTGGLAEQNTSPSSPHWPVAYRRQTMYMFLPKETCQAGQQKPCRVLGSSQGPKSLLPGCRNYLSGCRVFILPLYERLIPNG